MRELEASLVCPKCTRIMAKVYRAPTQREGVYVHETEPENERCDGCTVPLVRSDVQAKG